MNDNLLIELFLYFSDFVNKKGIESLFNKGTSNMKDYSILKKEVLSRDSNKRLDIKNFVFGANYQAVLRRVNNIPSGENYLFVDYGEINCDNDISNRRTDSIKLAITIAYRVKEFSSDLIEQLLFFSKAQSELIKIRNQMFRDQKCTPYLKNISENHSLIPFSSQEMTSVGWTLMFSRDSYDSFNSKGL